MRVLSASTDDFNIGADMLSPDVYTRDGVLTNDATNVLIQRSNLETISSTTAEKINDNVMFDNGITDGSCAVNTSIVLVIVCMHCKVKSSRRLFMMRALSEC